MKYGITDMVLISSTSKFIIELLLWMLKKIKIKISLQSGNHCWNLTTTSRPHSQVVLKNQQASVSSGAHPMTKSPPKTAHSGREIITQVEIKAIPYPSWKKVCTRTENLMKVKSQVLVSGSHDSAPGSWAPAQAEFEDTDGVLPAAKSPKTLSAPHQHSSKWGSSIDVLHLRIQ